MSEVIGSKSGTSWELEVASVLLLLHGDTEDFATHTIYDKSHP